MSNRRNNHHLNSQAVLLAFVILYGSIFLAYAYDPTGGVWTGYGGVIMEGTSPGGWKYVIGTDDSLWVRTCSSKWYNLGGKITSSPVVCRDYANWEHVFVRGTDGHLWVRSVDIINPTPTEVPGNWIDLGGYIKEGTSPTTVFEPWQYATIVILVQGGDGGLWSKTLDVIERPDPTTFIHRSTPIQGPWLNLGGKILGSPDCVDYQHTAVRGLDNALWVNKRMDPTTQQSTWHHLGGVLASDPSIIWDNTDNTGYGLLAYVKGTDGSLWVNKLNGQTMTGAWTGLGGQISGTDSPAPSSCSVDNTAFAFVKGTDNGLWACMLPGGIWYNLGGKITSRPYCHPYFYDRLINLGCRGSDGALWGYEGTGPT
jgi:hypothetical protein